ncbi:MAG: hypothetical protein BJ554DRAFT_5695 [Olpidium bornovanus]|uniref:Uncharacterized protein n=1 Tax=Olpidium bornovanus TaxID=278681 RepID=A0A8H8DME2_9FUNG|nr:MAG: hypothetical protein BJ554DRAFT_5695 [Olpidium bornovanus]
MRRTTGWTNDVLDPGSVRAERRAAQGGLARKNSPSFPLRERAAATSLPAGDISPGLEYREHLGGGARNQKMVRGRGKPGAPLGSGAPLSSRSPRAGGAPPSTLRSVFPPPGPSQVSRAAEIWRMRATRVRPAKASASAVARSNSAVNLSPSSSASLRPRGLFAPQGEGKKKRE